MASTDTKQRMDSIQASIIKAGPSNPNFASAVAEYVRLQAQYQQEVKAENSGALSAAKSQLAKSIGAMIESLKLVDLMGEPIKAVTYTVTPPAEGSKNGPVITIAVNPTRVTRRASGGNSTRAPRADGTVSRDLSAIFDANATVEDRQKAAKIQAEVGESGTTPNPKLLNSRLWSLKNTVANRLEDAQVPVSS